MQVEPSNPVNTDQTPRAEKPKVSVCVVTYNHEKYIGQCLQSIVEQEVNFDFEVIVGDDCSTDGTRYIVQEFYDKYPNLIKPIFRNINIGPSDNYFDVVNASAGYYIAHMDGDDLMLPGKLQRQADILDERKDISIVTHRIVSFNDEVLADNFNNRNEGLSVSRIEDLLKKGCFFAHSSKMYRESAIITRKSDKPVVDFLLHIEHALSGNIAFLHQTLGCYRLHEEGISKMKNWRKVIMDAYEDAFFRAIELGVDQRIVEFGRIRHRQAIALSELMRGEYENFRALAFIPAEKRRYANGAQRILSFLSSWPKIAYGIQVVRRRDNIRK